MSFGFDDGQQALRAAADTLLAAECDSSVVRRALEDADAWRPLWNTIVELGWTSLSVPEAYGGLGLGVVDLVGLAEVTGRWALPVPFLTTVGFAAPVLMAGSPGSPALAAIAEGTVTAVATGAVRWNGSTLSGTAHLVADATRADTIVVVARSERGLTDGGLGDGGGIVTVVPARSPNVRIVPVLSVDRNRPLADVHFDRVAGVEAVECQPEPGFDVARVVLAAELVGVAQRLLDMSVGHASTRVQFERPIGAFQAVKHRLVDTHVAVERARTLVYDAAMVHDDATTSLERRRDLASLAKAAASEAALVASRSAVQVHGAIAITWEHDVHLFSRRARQGAVALGDATTMYRRAARSYLEGGR